ncbi:hypothetical protein LCGC14_0556670 [marine sediment metagenome]|uniref:Uncharacterized protein n=1 Tax=marine sediment metagenome TaxID=412755 RepID=A0A0F9RTF1_9ZZZZ
MKSELNIAEENIEIFKNPFPDGIEGNPWTTKIREGVKGDVKESMETHKTSCERFLEFLEGDDFSPARFSGNYNSELEIIENKITDLKQAIKLYDGAGI